MLDLGLGISLILLLTGGLLFHFSYHSPLYNLKGIKEVTHLAFHRGCRREVFHSLIHHFDSPIRCLRLLL